MASGVSLSWLLGSFDVTLEIFFFNFFGCVGSSLLRVGSWAFSSCGERGLRLVAVHGLLIAVASLAAEHGLYSTGSVVVAHGLSCCEACGIFPDQGSNSCPLHWQADFFFLVYFLAALGLRCCPRAFSSCGELGLLFVVVRGLLIAVASLVAEHGLQVSGLQ